MFILCCSQEKDAEERFRKIATAYEVFLIWIYHTVFASAQSWNIRKGFGESWY